MSPKRAPDGCAEDAGGTGGIKHLGRLKQRCWKVTGEKKGVLDEEEKMARGMRFQEKESKNSPGLGPIVTSGFGANEKRATGKQRGLEVECRSRTRAERKRAIEKK